MKLSFRKRFAPTESAVYRQAISLTKKEFELLRDAVLSERALKFPRQKEYTPDTSFYDLDLYLKPLRIDKDGNCYLNHTQANFINLFCKLPIKYYYNTCLLIK